MKIMNNHTLYKTRSCSFPYRYGDCILREQTGDVAVVARYSLFIMQYTTELDLVISSYDFTASNRSRVIIDTNVIDINRHGPFYAFSSDRRIAINSMVLISGFISALRVLYTGIMHRRHKLYVSRVPFVSLVRLNEIWIRFICKYAGANQIIPYIALYYENCKNISRF